MAIIVFIHHPQESTGLLGQELRNRGHCLDLVNLYAGQPAPADLDETDGIISMGGPMNVDEGAAHPWIATEMAYLKRAHEAGVPILGVCLGAQLIAQVLGGQVTAMPTPPGPEIGFVPLRLSFAGTTDPLYAGVPWNAPVFAIHGQEAVKLPPEAVLLASTKMCKNQVFRVGLNTYAIQYHFEWDRHDLEMVARDPLVARANLTARQIIASLEMQYEPYRRVADRLSANIATLLFAPAAKLRI